MGLKSLLISYLLPLGAVFAVAYGCKQTGSAMHLCKHQYALCTSALCVPQPGDPSKAICFCDVEEGSSMSTASCDSLRPGVDQHGIRTVYSTFSFTQFTRDGKRAMKCPDGTPWTWCLNKRCTVDPSDATKAICICDVVRSGEWMTLGGECDPSTCETGYWSGATIQANVQGNAYLMRALGLQESPQKWCAP